MLIAAAGRRMGVAAAFNENRGLVLFTLRAKIILMIGMGMLLMLISIYTVVDYFYVKNVRLVAAEHLRESQILFNEHLQFDTEKLSAVLAMFERDEEFKKIFLAGDREKLFSKGEPLFKMLSEAYGISHFYFHLPDGTNFLRLHSKALFGDQIKRETFKTAVVTGKMATGIELGKTAFALRVIAPYHYRGKLIGYVELGEEIDHFVDFLKRTKKDEFGILAEKERLDRNEFVATNALRGVVDSWQLLADHVWIDRPNDKIMASGYISEANIEQFEHDPAIVSSSCKNGDELLFGGFPLTDVQRKHVGVVVTLMDISRQVKVLREMKIISFGLLLAMFIVIFAIINFVSGRWFMELITAEDKGADVDTTP